MTIDKKPKYQDRLETFIKRIKLISDTEWAYLAGILDGEGSIGLYQHTKRTSTSIMLRLTLVVNTDMRLIEYIANLLGKEFVYKTNKSNVWCVKTSHKAFAEQILLKIIPYLVIKKERAQNALNFIVARRGKYREKFTEEELNMVKLSKQGNAKMGRALW